MVADERYLTAAFSAVTADFGSLGGYLDEGLGLTYTTLDALRARLVE